MRIINEKTNNREIKIGKIDIYESCSKFDVDPQFSEEVMRKLQGFVFQNRDIGVIEGSSKPKRNNDVREDWRDRKRNDRRKSQDNGYDRRKNDSRRRDDNSYGDKKRKFRR